MSQEIPDSSSETDDPSSSPLKELAKQVYRERREIPAMLAGMKAARQLYAFFRHYLREALTDQGEHAAALEILYDDFVAVEVDGQPFDAEDLRDRLLKLVLPLFMHQLGQQQQQLREEGRLPAVRPVLLPDGRELAPAAVAVIMVQPAQIPLFSGWLLSHNDTDRNVLLGVEAGRAHLADNNREGAGKAFLSTARWSGAGRSRAAIRKLLAGSRRYLAEGPIGLLLICNAKLWLGEPDCDLGQVRSLADKLSRAWWAERADDQTVLVFLVPAADPVTAAQGIKEQPDLIRLAAMHDEEGWSLYPKLMHNEGTSNGDETEQ